MIQKHDTLQVPNYIDRIGLFCYDAKALEE